MMDVTVVVATYGDITWAEMAARRSAPSAAALGAEVVSIHGTTLHGARNLGLGAVDTEWVCFLDADDELEAGYFEAMETASADLRAPAVRYVRGSRAQEPGVPGVAGHSHACMAECLIWGNWLVIGTVARTDLVRSVGGFRDFPWSEDWDLWLRCYQAGATVEAVPQAIYRAHVRANSRNRAPSRAARLAAHQAIARANGVPVPA